MNPLLPLTGFLIGTLVGLTGMGAGVLMTPLLMIVFGLPPSTAVGTDLVYGAVTKIAGAWQHGRQGTVRMAVVRSMAAGSIPASLAAVALLGWMRRLEEGRAEAFLETAVAVALLLAAGLLLVRVFARNSQRAGSFRKPKEVRPPTAAGSSEVPLLTERQRPVAIAAVGALGGFLVGLTSVGSGSMILALLVMVTPLAAHELVGTDLTHAAILVTTAALGHLVFGHVDLAVAGQLLIGSIPGVLVGSRLSLHIPSRGLQIGLAGLLVASAAHLLH